MREMEEGKYSINTNISLPRSLRVMKDVSAPNKSNPLLKILLIKPKP